MKIKLGTCRSRPDNESRRAADGGDVGWRARQPIAVGLFRPTEPYGAKARWPSGPKCRGDMYNKERIKIAVIYNLNTRNDARNK